MTTLGGRMAGLSFAVRVPDEAHRRRVVELFADFTTVPKGDFVCTIEDKNTEVSDDLRYGKPHPEINLEQEGGIVRILIGKEKVYLGMINREDLQGTYIDIIPERFDLLFPDFFRHFVQTCLLKFEALIVHGCGVVHKDNGYLFVGQSGTGKTTIANNCDVGEVISDESVCIRRVDGRWQIHSTFWRCWNRGSADLARVFILHRDENEPSLRRLRPAEAVTWMSQNLFAALRTLGAPMALVDLMAQLASDVEFYRMMINPSEFSIERVVKYSTGNKI